MERYFLLVTLLFTLQCANARQISIYSTGFGDSSPEVIRQAKFYADYLHIESELPLIIMVMASANLPGHISGMMEHSENVTLKVANVMIKLNARLHSKDLQRVLAHEMVHVAQYTKGALVRISDTMFSWQGQLEFNTPQTPYRQRKWEKEAFGREKELIKAYERYAAAR